MTPASLVAVSYVAFALHMVAEYVLSRRRGECPDGRAVAFAAVVAVMLVSAAVLIYPLTDLSSHAYVHAGVSVVALIAAWRGGFIRWALGVRNRVRDIVSAERSEKAASSALVRAVVRSDEAALSAGVLPASRDVHLTRIVYARGGALRPLGLKDDEMIGETLGSMATPEFVVATRIATRSEIGQASLTTKFPDTSGRVRTYRTIVLRSDGDEAREYYNLKKDETLLVWFWVDVTEMGDSLDALAKDRERLLRMADGLSRLKNVIDRLP